MTSFYRVRRKGLEKPKEVFYSRHVNTLEGFKYAYCVRGTGLPPLLCRIHSKETGWETL